MKQPLPPRRLLPYFYFLLLSTMQFWLLPVAYAGDPPGTGRMYFTPACPIIAQNFNTSADVNGATSDPSAVGWYLDASKVPNATYFAVKSHRLKAQTLRGEGIWYSQVFSIAGYTGVQIDAKVSNEGSKSNSEYVKIYHKLDGGPEILDTALYGNFGTPLVKSLPMTGSTVQIVIHIYDTTQGNSEYYIEQYDVFKETGPCAVSTIPVTASATNGGILTCTNPSTTLSASTTATGTTTYSWSGPNNYSASSASAVVSAAGTYTVVASNAAGTGSATVTVSANNAIPDVSATGAALGCATSAVISASSSVAGATYSWSGPNGYSAGTASATVTASGSYTVTVRNPATGCTATQTVTVTAGMSTPATFWLEDFTLPNGTVSDTGSTAWSAATTGSGTYSVQNNEFKTSFSGQAEGVWTSGTINIAGKTGTTLSVDLRSETASGSDAFETADYIRVYYILNGAAPTLVYEDLAGIGSTTTGTASTTLSIPIPSGSTLKIVIRTSDSDPTERYYFDNVRLTGSNSITAMAAAGGMLTCRQSSISLSGSSTTPGAVYSWTGPGGFLSTVQNPVVTIAGIYTLTVTAGSCSASDTALVVKDTAAPQALGTTAVPSAAQLTCTNNRVIFTAGSASPGVNYAWTGPQGALSDSAVAIATAVGVYTVTATNSANGCSATASATVTQNIAAPGGGATTADPATAQITCAHPTVMLTGSSTTAGVTYAWSGPNNYTATGAAITVNTPGQYTVVVTDPSNGCSISLAGAVTKNVSVPVGLSASASDIISCYSPTIDLQGSSTTPGATFSWSGPGGYTASTAIAETSVPGSYLLFVTNPANGCTASTGTIVTADTVSPTGVTAANNGPLNCINNSVTLTGSTTYNGSDFLWVTPDNNFLFGATVTVTTPGVYTFVVTNDDNGCSSQAVTTVVRNNTGCATGATISGRGSNGSATALQDGGPARLVYKVYPNPYSSVSNIDFTASVSLPLSVELYNAAGYRERLLFSQTVTANQPYTIVMGAAGIAPGVHFCIIRYNGIVYTTKLILVK